MPKNPGAVIEDLSETTQLFEASSRLETAAAALEKRASGKTISAVESEAMKWAAAFLAQVDCWAEATPSRSVSVSLCVQATAVRPTYYACLIVVENKLRRGHSIEDAKAFTFSKQVFSLLQAGVTKDIRKKAPRERLALVNAFLHDISRGLLIQLTNNGAPRDRELLTVSSY